MNRTKMTPKEQITQLSNDIEGYINDYSGGITNKEDTIDGLIDYVLERVKVSNKAAEEKCMELNKENDYLEEGIKDLNGAIGELRYEINESLEKDNQ